MMTAWTLLGVLHAYRDDLLRKLDSPASWTVKEELRLEHEEAHRHVLLAARLFNAVRFPAGGNTHSPARPGEPEAPGMVSAPPVQSREVEP